MGRQPFRQSCPLSFIAYSIWYLSWIKNGLCENMSDNLSSVASAATILYLLPAVHTEMHVCMYMHRIRSGGGFEETKLKKT